MGGTLVTSRHQSREETVKGLRTIIERFCAGVDEGLLFKEHEEQRLAHEELREAYAVEIPMSHWLGELLSKSVGKEKAETILEGALEVMIEARSSAVEAYPDSLRVLERLREKGLKTAIISNISSGEVARRAARKLGIAERVQVLVTSEEIGLRKPHPAIFEHTARSLSLDPKKILHVGDSLEHDVRGAGRVGMTPLLLMRGRTAADAGARTVGSLDEVLAILGG